MGTCRNSNVRFLGDDPRPPREWELASAGEYRFRATGRGGFERIAAYGGNTLTKRIALQASRSWKSRKIDRAGSAVDSGTSPVMVVSVRADGFKT